MRRLHPIVVVLALVLCGALAPAAGATLTAHLREGTEPEALAVGPEGDLWYAGRNLAGEPRAVIGKIAAGGLVTEYVVPNSASAPEIGGMTRGPEGLMWFTRPAADRIEHMTAAGDFSGFTLSAAGSRPTGIVSAPGGFVWVTLEGSGGLGEIEPPTTVRAVSFPAGARPTTLAFGSDSALWAIEAESGTLLRSSLGGATSTIPLPSNGAIFDGAVNSDIVTGKDGSLWLSQIDGPWIGEVGLGAGSPEYVRYPVPVESGTTLVSPGPRFDIWFADEEGQIGSISTTGQVGEPSCAVKGCAPVQALAEGPEGGLWFAAGETIGTFTPPRLEVAAVVEGKIEATGRRGSIKVSCSGGAAGQKCTGHVEILPVHGGKHAKALARGRIDVVAQTTGKVKLRLTPRAARLLQAKGEVPVRAAIFVNRIKVGKPIERCPAKDGGKSGCATLLRAATP
jgi:virginiamycin B lyase